MGSRMLGGKRGKWGRGEGERGMGSEAEVMGLGSRCWIDYYILD